MCGESAELSCKTAKAETAVAPPLTAGRRRGQWPLRVGRVRWSAQYKATAKTTKAAVIMTATIKSTGMSYSPVARPRGYARTWETDLILVKSSRG